MLSNYKQQQSIIILLLLNFDNVDQIILPLACACEIIVIILVTFSLPVACENAYSSWLQPQRHPSPRTG